DLAPGGVALRLQERRDVVEDDDVPRRAVGVAGQLRARAHEYAAAAFVAQHELLAPLAVAALEVRRRHGQELREQRLVRGERDERLPDAGLEIEPEDRAGGVIRGADAQIRLERHDARRQARENDLELAALALEL